MLQMRFIGRQMYSEMPSMSFVKRAIGFETDKQSLFISTEGLKKVCSRDIGEVFEEHFVDDLTKKRFREATVIYCGVEDIDVELVQKIEGAWSREEQGRRLYFITRTFLRN
jgi:hypothetical protein